MAQGISPRLADMLINGVKVFKYRRPDGSEYETDSDFSKFGVEPIAVRRRPLTDADFS